MDQKNPLNTREKGRIGEKVALHYLGKRGFRVIGQNIHLGVGEIDILAKKGGILHFIEVKSSRYGFDLASIGLSPRKQRSMKRAVGAFFNTMDVGALSASAVDFCIDALLVFFDDRGVGRRIRVIFMENI